MTDRTELFENAPVPSMSDAEPLDLAREAAKILLNKKASQLKLLSVCDVTVIADYYVIVTGRSSTQIKALADERHKTVKGNGAGVSPMEAEEIIRKFYGLPERGAAQQKAAEGVIDIADFF